MSAPPILLLAAGASARMAGRDKLLELVAGRPLLRERAEVALATGAPVFVTLPPRAGFPDRWAALDGLSLTRVPVPRHADGLSASLAAGVTALPPEAPGVVVLLADMPEITADDLAALVANWDGRAIHRAAGAEGTPGNPVLFPATDFAVLAALSGDRGARDLLRAEAGRTRLVPLPGAHALTDLDTPEDWARWRG